MRRGRLGLLLLLALAASALPADPPPVPAPIARDPAFVKHVNEAIARGVAWLRREQKERGGYAEFEGFDGATTALAYQTLRACGVAPDDPDAVKAWAALRRAWKPEGLRNYTASLYLIAIAERGAPAAVGDASREIELDPAHEDWADEIAGKLASAQSPSGGWNYECRPDTQPHDDHGNTQYALLGLKAAARCGVKVDPAVWERAMRHLLAEQEPSGPAVERHVDGPPPAPRKSGAKKQTPVERQMPREDHARGWSYKDRAVDANGWISGAMTASGVGSLVICRSELLRASALAPDDDARSEQATWDGIAWLGGHSDAARYRGALDVYFLYSAERAGTLSGVEWFGPTDWYDAGAQLLLDRQAGNGSWREYVYNADLDRTGHTLHLVSTCYALLFLRKATAPVRVGAVTRSGGADGINFGAAASLTGRDLEDFVDLVLARWRTSGDDARARLVDGTASAGPRIVEPLFARMESADAAVRGAADAVLSAVTGKDFEFAPDSAAPARAAAMVRWRAWWVAAREKLVFDAATKRLVER